MSMVSDNVLMGKVKLKQICAPIADLEGAIARECRKLDGAVKPGMSVAVAVGSRGIANLEAIVRGVVSEIKLRKAVPFIVPAMGSHGGARAEGQERVLADYGVTEERVGAPVRSSMEAVCLGEIEEPARLPVYMDKNAYKADGVIVINRVKAHTDFRGEHESGIVKMLAIGLGKQAQAVAVHKYGIAGLRDYIPYVSKKIIECGKIIAAVAVLEDGYDRTSDIELALHGGIFELDARFLLRSKALMAKLPFEKLDTLIVGRMGKDISGTGMDTNVIGRLCLRGQKDALPECKRIVVLRLSEASHGNGLGVGMADVTTKKLADSIDWRATYENIITSGFLERGFLPIVAQTDREAANIAMGSCACPVGRDFRMAYIKDTLHLDEIYISEALWDEIKDTGAAELVGEFAPLRFDENGEIAEF